jgi:putative transposase
LGNGANPRQDEWTGGIAVGCKSFTEDVKARLGFRAIGRDLVEGSEGYQLRESPASYKAFFGAEKDDIGPENSYFLVINAE